MFHRAVVFVVVCVLAACGGTRQSPVDSGIVVDSNEMVDAAADAALPPPTRVRVVMYSGAFPVADVPVVFQRADDTIVADVKTGTDGVAEVELPEGGTTVSVLPTYSDGVLGVLTYHGVKPGDVLEVGSKYPERTFIDDVTLRLPPLPDGSRSYSVVQRCGTSFDVQSSTVALRPCGSPTNFLVRDDNNHSFYTDLLALRGGDTVDLTAAVFRGTRTITLRAENAPMPRFDFADLTTYTSDWLMQVSRNQSTSVRIVDHAGAADFAIADVPTVDVTAELALPGPVAGIVLWNRRQAPSLPFVFDFSQTGVAYIKDATYADNTVRWTELETGGDLAYAIVILRTPADARRVQISLFGPKTGTSLRIPTFPAPYANRNRLPSDAPLLFRAGIARATGGWDAVRRYAQLDDFFRFDWLHGDIVLSE
jgi:hypothetical protein